MAESGIFNEWHLALGRDENQGGEWGVEAGEFC